MITANIIKCNNCNDIIQSIHRHDFNMCKCGKCGVDGGVSYLRRIGENYTDMSLEDTDDIEKQRVVVKWGKNRNKDGEILPKTIWVLLKEIDDGHLDALIKYWEDRTEKYQNADKWKNIFEREKEYRNENT
jgi:hypothetical protein